MTVVSRMKCDGRTRGTANRVLQTVLCVLGPDVEAIRATPTGVPAVEVLLRSTGNVLVTTVVTCLLGLLFVCCTTNNVTTSSRQLWYAHASKNLIVSSADGAQVFCPRRRHSFSHVLWQGLSDERNARTSDGFHSRVERHTVAVQHILGRGFVYVDFTEPHRSDIFLPADDHFDTIVQTPRKAAATFAL